MTLLHVSKNFHNIILGCKSENNGINIERLTSRLLSNAIKIASNENPSTVGTSLLVLENQIVD